MEVMLLLIPLSVVLVLAIGALFWWSVGSGQFDDLEGPAHRIVADDDAPVNSHKPEIGALTAINPGTTGER
ncbi:MAG: cbb3-type cytochrome oxidase assembly protein CcoS [Betaproteobacteria bacterium]